MNNTAVISSGGLREKVKTERKQSALLEKLKKSGSLILIAAMFVIGSAVALLFNIPIKSVMSNYSYDVLAILIVMELFTNLIAETGIMQLLAIKIAEMSKGKKRLCLMMFGGMMFLISSCLNNITAVTRSMYVRSLLLFLLLVTQAELRLLLAIFQQLSL